ncbi:hypothetical protein HDA32_003145 [Spinactinospora alkalitolerans]|uniref:Uncharacterized protein n=1 Tax=Spinactinospora alkalitolerans TaxID=687207 RepID=A0A852TXD4_9ACTN|nr:hypothetical protein [Spinactinospora alkalitolerans]NYE48025.1 hypothetical protein [Spinactinospora alkalitolerans]
MRHFIEPGDEVDVKTASPELGYSATFFTQDAYQTVFPEVACTATLVPCVSPHRHPVTGAHGPVAVPGRGAGPLAWRRRSPLAACRMPL